MSLWQEVGEALVKEIDEGVLPPGGRLPTDYDLAVRFGVHRHTIRRALVDMQAQGLVRADRGKGTFVVHDVVAVRLGAQIHFEENLLQSNKTPRRTIISIAESNATKEIAGALRIDLGDPVLLVVFLGEADGIPIHTVRMFFPLPRFAELAELCRQFKPSDNIDLPDLLLRVGVENYRRKHIRIRCRLPTKEETNRLKISSVTPVFETNILNTDAKGVPVFFATTCFCGGRVEFVLDL